ncbi:hypothetical protein [Desulfobulbus oligotrophicus]|uniref:Uncharacterized protein n=1 Tax=Desulfobulbus oligotrophicus TaxID=1909699 RepID=A0A7T5VDL1_9BACT|nr:hypothetical protein [Desulfobulbus oligotrophicus]MDY0389376.1 hypothetical protein [Desulfobulbus oligotrophicus]QQG65980.1 hypothetical protein HP555_08915 [Desulfobulbus oligotrophicus]
MRTKRNQRGRKRSSIALIPALRSMLLQHVRRRLVIYLPACMPLLLVVLTHIGTLLTLVLIKSGLLAPGQLYRAMITWAVYGLLPLLFCSYGCFFAIARPVAGLLERTFPDLSSFILTLATGALYGVGISLALIMLLGADTMLRACLLVIVGLLTGLGNWVLYCSLITPSVQASSDT